MEALCSLVLRLTESAFRPMFLALCSWGLQPDAPRTRRCAFFRAVDGLAGMLKGLFVPYFANLVRPCVEVLQVCRLPCELSL